MEYCIEVRIIKRNKNECKKLIEDQFLAFIFITFYNLYLLSLLAHIFLSKLEVKKEKWVDLGKRNDEEERQAFIMESAIFNVSPQSGHLAPSETAVLRFTYRHIATGTHVTEILFQLKNGTQLSFVIFVGKCIKLMLRGKTLEPLEKYVHLAPEKHYVTPVPVGSLAPPVQTYTLYNDTKAEIEYELDLKDMQKVKRKEK